MTRTDELAVADLVTLATPCAEAFGPLRKMLIEQRRQLLRRLQHAVAQLGGEGAANWDTNMILLVAAHNRAPAVVDELLGSPQVGRWLVACCDPDEARRALELGQVGALAAVAAHRAGVVGAAAVPVRAGRVWLPTLGARPISGACDGEPTTVRCSDGMVTIYSGRHGTVTVPPDPHRDGPGWWGLRKLASGDGLQLVIDDVDPRDGTSSRLPKAELQRLRRLVIDAWWLLERDHPEQAAEVQAALTTIVPGVRRNLVATVPSLLAVEAADLPGDPVRVAELLVGGAARSKLALATSSDALVACAAGDVPLLTRIEDAFADLATARFWHDRPTTGAGAESAVHGSRARRTAEVLLGDARLTRRGAALVAAIAALAGEW